MCSTTLEIKKEYFVKKEGIFDKFKHVFIPPITFK